MTELPAELRLLEGALRRTLHRFDCPSPFQLGEYELDLISPEERTRIAAHAVDCARCMEELHVLRGFLRAAPDRPTVANVAPTLRRMLATLASGPGGAALSTRGADAEEGASGRGPLIYEAGGLSVTLNWRAGTSRARTSLLGLLIAQTPEEEPLAGAKVRLVSDGVAACTAEVDLLGSFAFSDVESGVYDVELCFADRVVVVSHLTLGEQL